MLTGKTALVTGAGQGIGRAIALKLAGAGADVIISDISEATATQTAADIAATGRKSLAIVCDVSKMADCEAMFEKAYAAFPQIDILVNNAGITRDNLFLRMKEEEWDLVIAINLKGVFNCCKASSRRFIKNKEGGRIINIASVIGVMGNAGQANYAASKAGVIALTKSLAREYASRNILCNAIAPGFIRTAMTDVLPDTVKAGILQQVPLNRLGEAEEVANTVLYLASPLASYVTGQVIRVDGGMIMA
ncbi:MAG: 3-oxoacyl-[acyl-carrier-protein] reductase [Candidatus Sumerlaeota bacterium]|nr:3-oxoacyl-[acyl-carrier-protein] reductase [Candidatus Sumerlaeota bacterium]